MRLEEARDWDRRPLPARRLLAFEMFFLKVSGRNVLRCCARRRQSDIQGDWQTRKRVCKVYFWNSKIQYKKTKELEDDSSNATVPFSQPRGESEDMTRYTWFDDERGV